MTYQRNTMVDVKQINFNYSSVGIGILNQISAMKTVTYKLSNKSYPAQVFTGLTWGAEAYYTWPYHSMGLKNCRFIHKKHREHYECVCFFFFGSFYLFFSLFCKKSSLHKHYKNTDNILIYFPVREISEIIKN